MVCVKNGNFCNKCGDCYDIIVDELRMDMLVETGLENWEIEQAIIDYEGVPNPAMLGGELHV